MTLYTHSPELITSSNYSYSPLLALPKRPISRSYPARETKRVPELHPL